MGAVEIIENYEELQDYKKVGSPFSIPKAALTLAGFAPEFSAENYASLEEHLKAFGAGLEITLLAAIPAGSGLGTSSILASTVLGAINDFCGLAWDKNEICSYTLVLEQLLTTGGGWQDQVGGVTNGIKYITSKPGLDQQLRVEHIELQPETKKELNERFCLIYTGQRRLARNLLRDVVGRYVGNEPDSLYALNEIQKVAALMRFELERGKIDEFADLLNYHWELSRKVDAGSTNTLIDQIFLSIEDLIDAKMVCGAGGGGFLQVILKKGVQKADVHKRLKDVFQDNPVDVWDCEII